MSYAWRIDPWPNCSPSRYTLAALRSSGAWIMRWEGKRTWAVIPFPYTAVQAAEGIGRAMWAWRTQQSVDRARSPLQDRLSPEMSVIRADMSVMDRDDSRVSLSTLRQVDRSMFTGIPQSDGIIKAAERISRGPVSMSEHLHLPVPVGEALVSKTPKHQVVIDGVVHRVHQFIPCALAKCDFRLVTSWYVGSPNVTRAVPLHEQELVSRAHMRDAHGNVAEAKGRKTFT